MNLPVLPEVSADRAATPESIGKGALLLHCKLAASAGALAAGGAAVDLAELGQDAIKAYRMAGQGAQQEEAGAADQTIQQQILDKLTALQGSVAELQVGQVKLSNQSVRVSNSKALVAGKLHPLRKERPPVVDNAAPLGALPPPGMFPSTSSVLEQLQGRELDALESFYEEKFRGVTVAERRKSFWSFINELA